MINTKLVAQLYKKLLRLQPLIIGLILFIFLILNIISTQTVSGLYFKLADEDQKSVALFLKNIRFLPDFKNLLEINKNIYGQSLINDVFQKEIERKNLIARLEKTLEKNPKARDVLHSLYLLYKEDGNNTKANEFLQKAKEIDPSISADHP